MMPIKKKKTLNLTTQLLFCVKNDITTLKIIMLPRTLQIEINFKSKKKKKNYSISNKNFFDNISTITFFCYKLKKNILRY